MSTTKVQDLPSGGTAAVNDYFVGERTAGTTVKLTYAPKLSMDPTPSLAANLNINGKKIVDPLGATILDFLTVAPASNYFTVANSLTGAAPSLTASGADTNISVALRAKGTGAVTLYSANTAVPLIVLSGTSNQHITQFAFSNTSATRTVTFPDSTGTVAYDTNQILINPTIKDSNSNNVLTVSATGSAVNYFTMANAATTGSPILSAAGSDTNINVTLQGKGTGIPLLTTTNTTQGVVIVNGTSYQHSTSFNFANTANSRTLTFPDVTDTVLTQTSPAITTPTITGFTNGSTAGAGIVGQELQNTWTNGGAITTGTITNVNSISLTAGDWLVYGVVCFNPAATTSVGMFYASIATANNVIYNIPTTHAQSGTSGVAYAASVPSNSTVLHTKALHVSVSSLTTYYLNAFVTYGVSTLTVNSGIIAIRIR